MSALALVLVGFAIVAIASVAIVARRSTWFPEFIVAKQWETKVPPRHIVQPIVMGALYVATGLWTLSRSYRYGIDPTSGMVFSGIGLFILLMSLFRFVKSRGAFGVEDPSHNTL